MLLKLFHLIARRNSPIESDLVFKRAVSHIQPKSVPKCLWEFRRELFCPKCSWLNENKRRKTLFPQVKKTKTLLSMISNVILLQSIQILD